MENNTITENTLYLLLENKLGALDKIINVLTLRGHQIEKLNYAKNKDTKFVDLKLTLCCTDNELEKVVKILHNQVNVIEIRLVIEEREINSI